MIYRPQGVSRDTKSEPAVQTLTLKSNVAEIRLKATLCFVIGVRYVVTGHRTLASELADTRHVNTSIAGEHQLWDYTKPR